VTEASETVQGDLEGQRLLRDEAGAVVVPRDVVRAVGADAATFLQGQLSQDVAGMAVGGSACTFVLQPQGKVDAWCRVSRTADEEFVFDIDAGFGEALLTRLNRFKLRVACDLEPLDWQMVALRGPEVGPAGTYGTLSDGGAGAVVEADPQWPGAAGLDLLGPDVQVPAGIAQCTPLALDTIRIEAGVPRMGLELTDATIPEETGVVARSVSFTKGCFTGQELVARIDSRGGNVARRLRGVVIPGQVVAPPPGASLLVDHDEVGVITSAARSRALDAAVALAYVPRKVEVPAEVSVDWGDGFASARVVELPLV
jgi:folate-binding protein YgfZ